jgi:hypothetical protein
MISPASSFEGFATRPIPIRTRSGSPYAAAAAAAYAKELLFVIPGQAVMDQPPIEQGT